VARGIPHRQEDGYAAPARLIEGLRPPLPPVDGIGGVLEEIWARGSTEAIDDILLSVDLRERLKGIDIDTRLGR
jgi:hypothetical protein